nr:RNA degradosome polyphosphate kinase [Succinivibrio sp.]
MPSMMPKELSWLSFNARVLQEAADPSVPLIERVRFLGIYSSNQDEFFKVRVAELKRQSIIKDEKGENEDTATLLRQVQSTANRYMLTQDKVYHALLAELAENKIYLLDGRSISQDQREYAKDYFKQHVLKHINPVIVDEHTDLLSFLGDTYTYLFVSMTESSKNHYALIEIPTDEVPRFVKLPSQNNVTTIVFLDDIIRLGLDMIFKGLFTYDSIEAYSIKMNRDAEYDLADSMDKSLLENMSESLKQRLNAMPVRFAYDADMPAPIVEFMQQKLQMSSIDSLMPGARYHNFKDFLNFPSVSGENLENIPLSPIRSAAFDLAVTPFDAIK